MVTNTASQKAHTRYEEVNPLIGDRETTEWRKPEDTRFLWCLITKWFGALSSALIFAAALIPNTFGISKALQPWVFVAAIFWFLAFCAGFFDL